MSISTYQKTAGKISMRARRYGAMIRYDRPVEIWSQSKSFEKGLRKVLRGRVFLEIHVNYNRYSES